MVYKKVLLKNSKYARVSYLVRAIAYGKEKVIKEKSRGEVVFDPPHLSLAMANDGKPNTDFRGLPKIFHKRPFSMKLQAAGFRARSVS